MIRKNNKIPLVTICIPTYNSSKTIKKTLKSILNQTYKNYKIIIVDNASKDNTIKIINSFKNKKIKIYKFKKLVNAEENWNRCIKFANGKYTAIYHSDDIYNKDIISKQVCFLEKNLGCGAVFTEGLLIDINDNIINKAKVPIKKLNDNFNYNNLEIFKTLSKDFNFLICPSAMVRTVIYQKDIKKFDYKKFGTSADLDAWLRILNKYEIGIIRQNLISYTISQNQQTTITRQFSKLPIFFKVMDIYIKKNFSNVQEIKENLLILKSYILLFLIIGSIQNNLRKNLNNLKKQLVKNLKKNKFFFVSNKKFVIYIILFLLTLTKNIKFLRKRLVKFLYFKFYKIA